ncbi:hypothetical protein [Stenomitos frigidus]|uniref:Uncharacterized protein n=1 Tax=Stenomitos frigidus ULC18 TaxID=2107698 RepID=A0A2T1EAN7_9CYAN|nr:hypothetical protein [Stenomitos frigidus]PSB29790.1 hypothetical protein C7B82_10560 [Stenomitos frigidus ULC18]
MSGYSYRDFQCDTEVLYTHLLNHRKIEQPYQLLERLHNLFVEGQDYDKPEVLVALNRIVFSKWADQEFNAILNRCCHILMNYWWSHLGCESPAVDLVELFQASPYTSASFVATRRLRELVKLFVQSNQYLELRQRVEAAELAPQTPQTDDERSQPIKDLVPRYPYLYPHCLMNWDSSDLGHQVISQLQVKKEQQFEQDLHRYTTHLLRPKAPPTKTAPEISNPTLLSNQQLETSIRRFAGKAEGSKTYQELAKQFVSSSRQAPSYRVVKRQMYDYLTASITYSDCRDYGKHHFNRWLTNQLEATLPQNDTLRPNGGLLVQTCGQLIDCLVANPKQQPNNHGVFVDLTTNLGATFTIGLLLKIVLLCRETKANLDAVKAYLAKRFAVVLKHYETKVRGEMSWLVECLENLMIAFGIHFGQADYSWVNLM